MIMTLREDVEVVLCLYRAVCYHIEVMFMKL